MKQIMIKLRYNTGDMATVEMQNSKSFFPDDPMIVQFAEQMDRAVNMIQPTNLHKSANLLVCKYPELNNPTQIMKGLYWAAKRRYWDLCQLGYPEFALELWEKREEAEK